MDGKGKIISRIRKRGCSSSSSSSLAHKYRFKKAILVVGKKTGSTTPVPPWKTECADNKSLESSAMPTPTAVELTKHGREVSVSARKLAATLWEIDKVKNPETKEEGYETERDERETRNRAKVENQKMGNALPPRSSDPSYYSVTEKQRRRSSTVSQKLQMGDFKYENLQIEAVSGEKLQKNGYIVEFKTRLKDVGYGLTTSKELLKVLYNICHLQHHNSSTLSLVSAMRFELDRAKNQINSLIREQMCFGDEIDHLLHHFTEKKAAWKRGERQRIRDSIELIAAELAAERRLRRQTERLNKKLGKELAETKEVLSETKREKEILEQVCEELANGMGEDRAEVEAMKMESVKVREEVEKEREMLQLADVLREERVQMKLCEARYQFEEKNSAVDSLRNELEDYLRTRRNHYKQNELNDSPSLLRIKELEAYLKSINLGINHEVVDDQNQNQTTMAADQDDSTDSDLHSIELNMDNNDRSYKWSFANNGEYSKRNSVDKKQKGRRSFSEKIPWGSICFEGAGTTTTTTGSNSIDWEVGRKSNEKSSDGFLVSEVEAQDNEEIKRYKSVKSLRDHILSSSRIAPVEEYGLKSKVEGKRGERRISTSSRGE